MLFSPKYRTKFLVDITFTMGRFKIPMLHGHQIFTNALNFFEWFKLFVSFLVV